MFILYLKCSQLINSNLSIYIQKFVNAIAKYFITQKIYPRPGDMKEMSAHIAFSKFSDYFEDWDQQRWAHYYETKIASKV